MVETKYPYYIITQVDKSAKIKTRYVFCDVSKEDYKILKKVTLVNGALPSYVGDILGQQVFSDLSVSMVESFIDMEDSLEPEDEEVDFGTFLKIVNKAAEKTTVSQTADSSIVFIDIPIVSYDTIESLKEKISLYAGIPIEKQHLYCSLDNGTIPLMYTIVSDGSAVPINVHTFQGLKGKYSIKNNDLTRVDTLEGPVFLVDFDDIFMDPKIVDYKLASHVKVLFPMYQPDNAPEERGSFALENDLIRDMDPIPDYSVTSVAMQSRNVVPTFDIRTAIDSLVVSLDVPFITANVLKYGKQVSITKTLVQAPMESSKLIPVNSLWFKARIKQGSKHMLDVTILPNGSCQIHGEWTKESAVQESDIISAANDIISKVIRTLSGMTPSFVMQKMSIVYSHVTSVLHFHNTGGIVDLVTNTLIDSEIVRVSPESKKMYINRGMVDYDTSKYTYQNEYDRYWNESVKTDWIENVLSKKFIDIDYSANLTLTFHGITSREVDMCGIIARNMFNTVEHNKDFRETKRALKEMKKLKQFDPYLYQPNKYFTGSSTTYSKLCQKPHQPVVVTTAELEKMPKHAQENAIQFINYTYNEPVIYTCPNKEYPYISFIVDEHPQGYCIPCCKKTHLLDSKSKERQDIFNTCMRDHVYRSAKVKTKTTGYLSVYGKTIEPGRFSRSPELIQKLWPHVTLLGVQQDFPGPYYGIAMALDLRVPDTSEIKIDTLHTSGYGTITFKEQDKNINLVGSETDIRDKNIMILERHNGEVYPMYSTQTESIVFDMLSEEISEVHSLFMSQSKNIITVQSILGKYPNAVQLVANGTCYAMLIGKTYVPVEETVPVITAKTSYDFPRTFSGVEETQRIIEELGSTVGEYLVYNGLCYGFYVGDLIAYAGPEKTKGSDTIHVDPHRLCQSEAFTFTAPKMYYRYIYKVLVWKVNSILRREKNKTIREQISKYYQGGPVPSVSVSDMHRIINSESVDDLVLDADFEHIRTDIETFKKYLVTNQDRIVTFVDKVPEVDTVQNIIAPDSRIFITSADWASAVDLLSRDFIIKWDWITDPRISSLTMNFFKFKKYPGEKITVKIL